VRFLLGVLVGATLGALLRRAVVLALLAPAGLLLGGAVDRIGPLTTRGADVAERLQNVDLREVATNAADRVSAATIERAVDGDTLVVRVLGAQKRVRVLGAQKRVRVLGIDTPETVRPNSAVECWGPQASASAKRWATKHRRVRLRRDPAAPDEDRYGRLLRYVDPVSDGRDLSTIQIAGGHARVAAYGQRLDRLPALRTAERRARREGRGLWGACRS